METGERRVFIIHGWDGSPEEGWFPWLKKELEQRGFVAIVPQLPDAQNPRIYSWVPALAEAVGTPDAHTYFVGHSMGCQAIVRYLETLPEGVRVGGAVFVAGFFKRLTLDELESKETEEHWLRASLDFSKIKEHLPKSMAIFSDNDPWVPIDNQDGFREKLGSEIIIKQAQGHFSDSDGVKELPIVLEKILEISK